jgi:hypothetical protein
MPSTYTTNLRTEQQATGENRSTWGTKANRNFQLLEDAITKQITVALSDADYSLTTADGATDEARCATISFSGTLTANRTITIPSVDKIYLLYNGTTGGKSLSISNGTTSVTLANGAKTLVYNDGTAIWQTFDLVSGTSGDKVPLLSGDNTWSGDQTFSGTVTLSTALPIAQGGTGSTSASTARTALGLGALAVKDTVNNADWSGTDLSVANGGTGASDAATARNNLGLGAVATLSTIPIANGGTGSTTASGARTALGLGTAATTNSTAYATAAQGATADAAMPVTGGTFTGAIATVSTFQCNGYFIGNSNLALLGTTTGGTVYLRPNGYGSGTGQTILDTNGNMTVNGGIWVGSASVTGTVTAAQVTYSSDRRLKSSITPIKGALDKVRQLSGYLYHRDDLNEDSGGLIAQEVFAVLPEAVREINGSLSIDPGAVLGLLLQAIKEIADDPAA